MSKSLKASVAAINEACARIPGMEINFDEHGDATIYWHYLRVKCSPDTIDEAFAALKTLNNMGTYFE